MNKYMNKIDVIDLTKKLIRFDTKNPPGNERAIAEYCGALLTENGFAVKYPPLAENRMNVIAEKGLSESVPPIVFTGHFDTVPLGLKKWSMDPLGAEIRDGKIYGRGSSDMKSGVAAMICAVAQAFEEASQAGGVRLILTAGEETGCQGACDLEEKKYDLGNAAAVVVGEPTANLPVIGHKGALFMKAQTSGITAHSSMPHMGDNAIYKAARAISKIENFNFSIAKDSLLGYPTINVGMMKGGMNANSVPDHAEFTIDVRSTTLHNHADILKRLNKELGADVVIEPFVDLPPVYTAESEFFVQMVYEICAVTSSKENFPLSLPYMTDGSLLQCYYNGVPTIILGPGQPEMAHQTDEYCYIDKIEKSVEIYKKIILQETGNRND
jgi:succinyl-diaminopimelate desuccinylase